MKTFILLTTFLISSSCQDTQNIFDKINSEYVELNSLGAELAWQSSLNPEDADLMDGTAKYQKKLITWLDNACRMLKELPTRQLLPAQRRQIYLLCRGPHYNYMEARSLSKLYDQLQTAYTDIAICLPAVKNSTKDPREIEAAILDYLSDENQIQDGGHAGRSEDTFCLVGENEVSRMMESSKNPIVLKWLWLMWREKLASMKKPFGQLVLIENQASRRNGFPDIGAAWRDELEIPELRDQCRRLYADIRPLYTLLHGVTRFYLRRYYGDIVPEKGPIPAHLLGNLWAQSWEALLPLISRKSLDLDKSIENHKWSVEHMVMRVEDFYMSMGLPAMTDAFWRESVFQNNNGTARCHGTAADMFKDGDYRLLYCAGTTMQDFYVLHHEFGHIQYYMAYAHQPGLFRQANAAFHESIGDAIMYGVMTPQHLHRLGLVNDTVLFINTSKSTDEMDIEKLEDSLLANGETETTINLNDDVSNIKLVNWLINKRDGKIKHFDTLKFVSSVMSNPFLEEESNIERLYNDDDSTEDMTADEILLLRQALNKIPQIPFALVLDEYRWKYFEGGIDTMNFNKEFWDLTLELQGVAPNERRLEEYFDIAAKFHVPDNTPYIRYFLSSFIQHQIFEALCRAAVFGNRGINARVPDSISLHRCDIYGSKAAGKLLRSFMSRGNSHHWRKILKSTTGNNDITAAALKKYYRPLYKLLVRIVAKHKIPLGW